MTTIRRFTKNLTLSLESLFDEIQNHEADVAATIREVERGSIRVRAQRAAAERRLQQIEEAQESARNEHQAWQARAVRLQRDPTQALECLRRARVAKQTMDRASDSYASQRQLLEQLSADERTVESKLAELKQKRASLVSREARATALGATSIDSALELETVFDRWQARIEEREAFGAVGARVANTTDAFARVLSAEEEQRELEQELVTLLAQEAVK